MEYIDPEKFLNLLSDCSYFILITLKFIVLTVYGRMFFILASSIILLIIGFYSSSNPTYATIEVKDAIIQEVYEQDNIINVFVSYNYNGTNYKSQYSIDRNNPIIKIPKKEETVSIYINPRNPLLISNFPIPKNFSKYCYIIGGTGIAGVLVFTFIYENLYLPYLTRIEQNRLEKYRLERRAEHERIKRRIRR